MSTLIVNASGRTEGSVTRQMVEILVEKLGVSAPVVRDVGSGLPPVDAGWIGNAFNPAGYSFIFPYIF